jgi:probable phosphoglycerate mutase
LIVDISFGSFMTEPSRTCFGMLRHSVTEWNQSRRIQGQADSPLTFTGEAMALRWGQILAQNAWQRILSSDLGRARKTAELINQTLNLPLTLDSRLREMDWGRWTGKTTSQLKIEFSEVWTKQTAAEWDFCPPEGESFRGVWKRGLEALTAASCNWPGENILVVTHEGMIKSMIYHESTRSDFLKNGQCLMPYHLHCLMLSSGRLTVEYLNFVNLSS